MDPNDHERRRELLTELLGGFGEGSEIRPPFRCDYGYQTFVGARSFANLGLVSLDVATVTIGDDVQIGPERAAADGDPPGGAGPAAGQVGGGRADRDRRQRLARRRCDRLPRRHDRRGHGRRGRFGRRPGPARRACSRSALPHAS